MLKSGLPENPRRDVAAIRLRNWLSDTFLGGNRGRKVTAGGAMMQGLVYAKAERALQAFHAEEQIDRLIETRNELFPLVTDEEEELALNDTVTERS